MLTRRLQVTLRQEQIADRSLKLARKLGEIDDIRKEKSLQNASWTAQIKRLEDEAAVLAETVRHGFEEQDVEVDEKRDYENRTVRFIRLDEGVEFDNRPMTSEEMGELQVDAFKDQPTDGETPVTTAEEAAERVRKDVDG